MTLRSTLSILGIFAITLTALFSITVTPALAVNGCPGDDIPDANGVCQDPSRWSDQELCDYGYSDYCDSNNTASGNTYRGPDGDRYEGNSPNDHADYWCSEGYTEYCSGGASSSGGDNQLDAGEADASNDFHQAFQEGDCEFDDNSPSYECTNDDIRVDAFVPNSQGELWSYQYYGDGEPCGYRLEDIFQQSKLRTYETIPADQCEVEGDNDNDPNDPNQETTDICPNLPGTQTSVPQGYTYQSGQCVESTTSGPCTEQRTGTGKGSTTQTICNCPAGYIQQGSTCVAQPNQDPTDNPNNPNNLNQPENNEPWDGKVFLIPVDTTAHESGNTASFRVAINGSRSTPLDVGLTFRGTATQYTDYTLQGGGIQGPGDNTATIAANQTQSGLIILTPVDDDIYEGTETVRPTLRDLAGYNLGNPAQITITIQDNDTNCPNVCLGGNVVNSCTGNLVETCSFSCGSGICIPPPSPELLNWNVLPRLVHRGDSVTLTWSTDYTESCAIQRSNGATWTGLNTTGTRTDTIQQETTYVLSCLGLDETTLTSPAITVRIVPDWQEI